MACCEEKYDPLTDKESYKQLGSEFLLKMKRQVKAVSIHNLSEMFSMSWKEELSYHSLKKFRERQKESRLSIDLLCVCEWDFP